MPDHILQTPSYEEPIESIFPYELGDYPLTALNPDPVTRLHYHSVFEIGICISGRGKCIFTDNSVSYEEGDATFFAPYQAHFSRCDQDAPSAWYWFYFDLDTVFSSQGFLPEYWRSLGEMSVERSGILKHSEHPEMCRLIRDIIQAANNVDLPERNITVSLLLARFLVEASKVPSQIHSPEHPDNSNGIFCILPAIKYIRQHYHESLSIVELAGLCNMSQSTFRRRFHDALNMSPYTYIMNVRMKIAAHYLSNSEITVSAIAQNCGIMDPANFIHHFSKKYHVTPTQYREANMH